MNDLTILHLSDLHISWSVEESMPTLHRNLLHDIKNQEKFLSEPIIVVITGDIVNEGDYSENSRKAVIRFFETLYDILKGKVKDIIIVPGNHDKEGIDVQNTFSQLYATQETPMEQAMEDLLNLNNQYYKKYLELANEIYDIFKIRDKPAGTYGVRTICISQTITENNEKEESDSSLDQNLNVCFICLNSTLACSRKKDYRHLRLGQYQLEALCKEHQAKSRSSGKDPVLTFIVSHHPLSWLVGEEENIVQDMILSPTQWNANIFLCGHVHQRDAIGMRNNHHSLTTFTTGFGWPDPGKPQAERHTYSYYVFNLDYNSIDIYVRSTSDGGDFMPDFTFYGEGFEKKYPSKVVYPIDSNKTQAYYEIGSSNGRSGKAFYFSDQFVRQLESYGQKMCVFQSHISTFIAKKEDNFLFDLIIDRIHRECEGFTKSDEKVYPEVGDNEDNLIDQIYKEVSSHAKLWNDHIRDPASADSRKIRALINDNIAFVQKIFSIFVQALCIHVVSDLCATNQQGLTEAIAPTDLRFHARYYSRKFPGTQNSSADSKIVEQYKQFCVAPSPLPKELLPSDMPWENSLIKTAFESGKSLIYQNNREQSISPNCRWKNFITIIPVFPQNVIFTNQGKRPLMTFGLSITESKYNHLLYLLEFFKMELVLGNMIESFLRSFPIDLQAYFEEIDSENRSQNQ